LFWQYCAEWLNQNTIFPQSGIPALEPTDARKADVSNFEQIRFRQASYISSYTLWFHCAAALSREEEG
jgi:hypothetical protein